MPAFENYGAEARRLELEIERKGIVLGIDWEDEVAVAQLARSALAFHPDNQTGSLWPKDPEAQARVELYAMAHLMLKVMTESAEEDIRTHGGKIWKALGRALWRESRGQTQG